MLLQRTTACQKHQHPEFQINYDPALVPVEDDVRWFLGWLEQSVSMGEKFSDGQTCQVGWAITEMRSGEDGVLCIWEPDIRQMPIAWVESVSHTLNQLRLQKDVCESVFTLAELSFPSMRQSAIICTKLGTTEAVIMERSEPRGNDSGWFVGCRDEDHDHNNVGELKCVSLYEAAVRYQPRIIPFLALPPGVLLSVGNDAPAVFQNGQPLALKPGSYLATRYATG